jgi:ketosteroid isomerase-like protein
VAEHRNAQLVRQALDSLLRGDLATFCSAFADDVVWHVPGDGPLAGEYRGLPGLLALFGRQQGLSDGTLRLEITDVMASDEHAVAWQRVTAARDNFNLDVTEALVFRIDRGKVTEVWQRTDQYSVDDFFSYGASRRRTRKGARQAIPVGVHDSAHRLPTRL